MLQTQRLARPLLAAVRGLVTSSASGAGVESVGIAPFPSWLPASHASVKPTRLAVPLSKALPGVSSPGRYTESPAPPPTEVTRLDNGATIISEASPVRARRFFFSARRRGERGGGVVPSTHARTHTQPTLAHQLPLQQQTKQNKRARRRAWRSTSTPAACGSGSL